MVTPIAFRGSGDVVIKMKEGRFMNKALLTILSVLLLITLALTACSSPPEKKAEDPPYPTKQIEYVVAAAAGGSTDLVARAVAEYVSKEFGQPILVVNKPGGGTAIGGEYALKQAKPDGYTIYADNHSASTMMVGGMVNPPIKMEDRIFVSQIGRAHV